MDFKKYRLDNNLTQAQAGALLGVSGTFWGSLESGKEGPEREHAFARVLRYLDHPSINLPLTPERMNSVKDYGLFYWQASRAIGAGDNTWSNILNGHTSSKKRWQMLCNALLIELGEKEQELKRFAEAGGDKAVYQEAFKTLKAELDQKKAALDLTPAGDIEIIQPTVLTPGPETDMEESEILDHGLIPFSYGQSPVRCVLIDSKPWFVLRDICNVIEYRHTEGAARLVREKDLMIRQTLTPGGPQDVLFVSEPGLYQLLSRCRVPAAEPFQDWLFDEVLPQIRKTGQYAPTQVDPIDAAILSLQRIKQIEAQQAQLTATIEAQAQQIEQIKQQGPIDTDKAALQTLQKLQSLESRRNELHNLVAQVVSAADRSKHIIASSYCSYQAVWRAVFNASNPPVNKLAGYTSLAQINTGIEAAKQLLETLLGKAPAEQLKIEIEGDAA